MYLGVVTSYIYTLLYIAEKGIIIDSFYIDNTEFNNKISFLLDRLFEKYGKFIFISLFLGPSPLLSCRTSLTFFQAIIFSLKIPIITQSGIIFYQYASYDYIVVQNFSDSYLILNTVSQEEEKKSSLEVKNLCSKGFKCGLVARKGHVVFDDYNVLGFIIFPDQEKLALLSWFDFLSGNIKNVSDIRSFF
jgi:hypothetical protein